MAEIHFYHLTSTPLERVLPKLLEKAVQGGFRSIVRVESEEKAEWMNNMLWTYDPNSFLPHGSTKDGFVEQQPIYITSGEDNPNNANLLIVTDHSEFPSGAAYDRVIDIFDGSDIQLTTQARERWKKYKAAGHALEYRQQAENGSWIKNS